MSDLSPTAFDLVNEWLMENSPYSFKACDEPGNHQCPITFGGESGIHYPTFVLRKDLGDNHERVVRIYCVDNVSFHDFPARRSGVMVRNYTKLKKGSDPLIAYEDPEFFDKLGNQIREMMER